MLFDITTPTRSELSRVIVRPASAAAIAEAATASWLNLAIRRAGFGSMYRVGSNPLTGAAMWVGYGDESNGKSEKSVDSLNAWAPDTPAMRFCQVSSAVLPTGVRA